MKWIKRLCSFLILTIVILIGALCVKGYMDYREALNEKSVEEMAAEIESIDNYTTIDELPQTYIDAVLAVEDNTGCQYSSWLPAGGTEAAPYFYANGSSDGLGKSHATVYIYFMPDNRDLKWLDLTIGDTVLRVDLEGGVRP